MNPRPGHCYGGFDAEHPVCDKCAIRLACKTKTAMKSMDAIPVEPKPPESQFPLDIAVPEPFDYFTGHLRSKFECEENDNDKRHSMLFTKDGIAVVQVVEAKETGRVKITSKRFERTLDSREEIDSVETAETFISRIVGKS